MGAEYKKHQWLVYTASRKMNSVGWPMAVAEAQAAGVGVCLPNIRADLQEYLGGAGFLYDSINEVIDIIRNPFRDEMRQRDADKIEHGVLTLGPLSDRTIALVPRTGRYGARSRNFIHRLMGMKSRIVVDYAHNLDTGDWLNLCDARIAK